MWSCVKKITNYPIKMKFGMLMFLGLLKLNLDLWNSQPGVSKPPPNCGRRSRPPGRMAQPPCRWGAKPLTLGQMKAVLWGRWSCPQPSEEKQGTRPKGSYPFLYVQMLIWIPDLLHRHFPCWWKLTPPPFKIENIIYFGECCRQGAKLSLVVIFWCAFQRCL